MKSINLMPLRIPSGWKVVKNILPQREPSVDGDRLIDAESYHSGMILLQRDVPVDREDAWWVDLGWVPSYSREGSFRLVLFRSNESEELCTWSGKRHDDAVQMLERWLMILASEPSVRRALALVRTAVEATR